MREKQKRQERLRRWLIPTSVTVVVLAIVAIVVLVVITSAPPPAVGGRPEEHDQRRHPVHRVQTATMVADRDRRPIPAERHTDPDRQPTRRRARRTSSPTSTSVPGLQGVRGDQRRDRSSRSSQPGTPRSRCTRSRSSTATSRRLALLESRATTPAPASPTTPPTSFYAVMAAMFASQPHGGHRRAHQRPDRRPSSPAPGSTNGDVDTCINGRDLQGLGDRGHRPRARPDSRPEALRGQFGTPTVLVNGAAVHGQPSPTPSRVPDVRSPSARRRLDADADARRRR